MSSPRGRERGGRNVGNRKRKATGWNREWPRSVSIQAFASILLQRQHPRSSSTPLAASGSLSLSLSLSRAQRQRQPAAVALHARGSLLFQPSNRRGAFHAGPRVYIAACSRPATEYDEPSRLHYAMLLLLLLLLLLQVQYRSAFVPPSIATAYAVPSRRASLTRDPWSTRTPR